MSTPLAVRLGVPPRDRHRADERLNLDEERAGALGRRGDDAPWSPARALGEKERARVRDLAKTIRAHLEDAHLGRAPEAVLLRAERAQGVEALALEGEHRVDEVLEDLRAREDAVLRDVADEQRRNRVALGTLDES